MKMAQASCGQTLANHISVFPIEFDELSKYSMARVTAYNLCKAIFIKISYSMCALIPLKPLWREINLFLCSKDKSN